MTQALLGCLRVPCSPPTLVALTIAGIACDQPPPEPEAARVTVWDSAGIEIIENHAPEWGDSALWSVDPEPEFVIGGSNAIESPDDASRLIWQVRGLARLSDGNILVHSGGEEAVFLFEPSGELVTRIGRKGRGPGEFVRPEHIQVLPGGHHRGVGLWHLPGQLLRLKGDFRRRAAA